jgi:hypothetical protein
MKKETPTIELFNEIKKAAIKVWETKDNTYGYVTEKLERVNSIENYKDNVMTCYNMFDIGNQLLMKAHLSDKALTYIKDNY